MLPETGKISMKDVNVELERIENSKINLNEEKIRKMSNILFGKISLGNLHNKYYVNYSKFESKHNTKNSGYQFINEGIEWNNIYNINNIGNMNNLIIGFNSNFRIEYIRILNNSKTYPMTYAEGNFKNIKSSSYSISKDSYNNNPLLTDRKPPNNINELLSNIHECDIFIEINKELLTNDFIEVYVNNFNNYIIKDHYSSFKLLIKYDKNTNTIQLKSLIIPNTTKYNSSRDMFRISTYDKIIVAQHY